MYLVIETLSNSWGKGYRLRADYNKGLSYYGYSLPVAISLYRKETGLQGKHLQKLFI